MGDRLAPGAGAVNVGDEVGREDGEVGGEALGGDVDVGVVGWGRGREEDRLAGGPVGEVGVDGGVQLHCGGGD